MFLEYITNLAPEGETALFVRQKPILVNGEPQFHGDGTQRYTWPAFLPEKWKPNQAWYGNTGSFILERLKTGKLSASAVNCEYVLCMVLDDIGTKSKTPPLEPTWKMETSPDNFQWGYAFTLEGTPTKQKFSAAIKAIAEAGFTDGGSINPVRNFRLPGSLNFKPGKNNFLSVLSEFTPEREFSLDQICQALGVTPNEADTATHKAIALADDGNDDILNWVAQNGMLLERGNDANWWGVMCPNAALHTTGNPMGRYNPVTRAYCCWHEHCQGLDSNTYLEWIANNGGPKQVPGLRPELLSEIFREKILPKLTPNTMFNSGTDNLLAEIERKELGRLTRDEWFTRFAYIQDDDAYFDMLTNREVSRGTFNALYRHIPCNSIINGRRIEASIAFDESREARGSKALVGLTYAAGETQIVGHQGQLYGNRWIDARPDVETVEITDIRPWLAHCSLLIPNELEREHVFNVMAYKLQNPGIKINHAVLHVGDEGCGKDTVWAPFIWGVCGPRLKNRGYMDNDTVHSQWGYDLESEILIINELKEPSAIDRRALANKLKPIIAAPPEVLNINRKGLHPYQMANRVFVLAFSNEQVPISLASQDRRWFCIHSCAPRMTDAEGKRIWDWFHAGGFHQVTAWLWDRNVSAFNPAACPAMTDFKAQLIEQGMSMAESFIVDMLKNRVGEFAKGVIGSPLHAICDRLASLAPTGVKVPQAALLYAIKEAGWVDCGLVASADYPNKKRLYMHPDLNGTVKSELRRLLEVAKPNNVVELPQRKAG